MSSRVLVEICVGSVDDALGAAAGGADRLEVNSALALGGLTPSAGLFSEVRRHISLPLIAMVRPRPGGFCYSAADFEVMLRDAEWLLNAGADGLAFGILTPAGRIDGERCRRLRTACGTRDAVFHRAFDLTPDPRAALDELIDLGFARVMTSGQAESAPNGMSLIADLVRRAAGRIQVLPAAGINATTAGELVAQTGCNQVHASSRATAFDGPVAGYRGTRFGLTAVPPEGTYEVTDRQAVASLRAALPG